MDSINSITADVIWVENNTFLNNTSGKQGVLSFVDCKPGWIIIVNNTFGSNSAKQGAGLYFGESSEFIFIDVLNCTFEQNYAEEDGGAIFFSPYSSFKLIRIQNCLFGN